MTQDLFQRGLDNFRQGNYTEAINIFNQVLVIYPDWAIVYYRRGLAKFDLGDWQGAIADYGEALSHGDGDNLGEVYLARAMAYLAIGDLVASLTDGKKFIEINPDQPAGYKLLASIYRRQNQADLAVQSWKKAAELYLKLADKENCRFCLDQIKALSVKPLQNQVSVQNSQHSQNLPTAPNAEPMITVEKYLLGILRKFDRGDRTGAIFDLNWLLKADPQDGQAYCYRGILQNKQGDNWAALQDLTRALQLNSHNVIAYRYRGTVRSQVGDLAGAIADLNTAINLQPEQPSLYVNRGNIYREAGNIELGFADYQKAIDLNPDEGFAYYNRAIFYARLEEINRAIADYQTAIRIFGEKGAWQNYQKALESLQKIQPSSSISHNSAKTQANTINQVYEKLRQKLFRLVGGQWEIAESLISQCKYLFPGRSEQWYLEKVIGDIEK